MRAGFAAKAPVTRRSHLFPRRELTMAALRAASRGNTTA
jgi:hypothetical protein